MKYIKRKSAVKPITGSIVDTTNIDDKTKNTYSASVIDAKTSNLFITLKTTVKLPIQTAGNGSYLSTSITIPDGYVSYGCFVRTSSISDSYGLQFTPLHGHNLQTGSVTLYINYYSPKATTKVIDVEVYVKCIKEEMLAN